MRKPSFLQSWCGHRASSYNVRRTWFVTRIFWTWEIFRNCLNNSLSISIEHSVAGSVLCGLVSGNMIEHSSIYPSFPPHNHPVMLITLAIDLFGFADELILGSGPCPSHWSEGLRPHPVPIAGWFCSRHALS